MKKKLYIIFILLIISACTPQVIESPTVTLTSLPTETPLPTPTLHPQFIELQNLISDAGDRFTLTPDGLIEEVTTDGGRQTIPNFHVDQNGIVNLIINNEHVRIEKSQVTFDDENGLSIDGYELDEDGNWVEAVSEAVTEAKTTFGDYGYDYSDLTFSENEDGTVIATDDEGKVVYEDGKFDLNYAIEQAGQLDLMPTNIEPDKTILEGAGQYVINEATRGRAFTEYFGPLFKRVREQFEQEYGYDPVVNGKSAGTRAMLDDDINAWGTVTKLEIPELSFGEFIYYELADSTIHIVPLQ